MSHHPNIFSPQHLFENGRVENIFMDRFYIKFSNEFTTMLKRFEPSIAVGGESASKCYSLSVFLVTMMLISVLCKHAHVFSSSFFLTCFPSSSLQVTFILVWRKSFCGTANSWVRTPPSSSSTPCSSSAASTSVSPQCSSTGSCRLPTSWGAPRRTRTTPRPPTCASTHRYLQMKRSRVRF